MLRCGDKIGFVLHFSVPLTILSCFGFLPVQKTAQSLRAPTCSAALSAAILRANRSIYLMRSAVAVTPAASPCRKEFRLDRFLPAAERGPVLRRALRRLAAICRTVVIVRPMLVASSLKRCQAREFHHRSRARRLRASVEGIHRGIQRDSVATY
jgi:hypothetical protein